MTEAEWRNCTDPRSLLNFLQGKATDRKLRLFALACCRRLSHLYLFPDKRTRKALKIIERYADNFATQAELNAAEKAAYMAACKSPPKHRAKDQNRWGWPVLSFAMHESARLHSCLCGTVSAVMEAGGPHEPSHLSDLVRDLFGNPFHHVHPDRAWLTPAAVEIAMLMYDAGHFGRMPALADLLDSAGCTNAEVVGHCRGPGPHVRGCWVVDLVLRKS